MLSVPRKVDAPTLAVRTRSLTKLYGKQFALRDVELTVPEHSFYVLVGPNGAGKTTLLKLLLEIIHPTRGEIEVLGLNPLRNGAAVRANVGYIPERSEELYTWMSVKTAIEFHRRYYPAWDVAYADDLLQRLRIKHGKLNRLSKGEARRVQIVMALAHRPPILVLDEPTDGLDPVGRDVFLSILAEHLATTPTTVIVSTHLVYEMERLADHFAVLRDGEILTQMSTDQMQRKLKRYVMSPSDVEMQPPAEVLIGANGGAREKAFTLWGDESELASQLQARGASLKEVRPLTLEEAAVAFLSGEH